MVVFKGGIMFILVIADKMERLVELEKELCSRKCSVVPFTFIQKCTNLRISFTLSHVPQTIRGFRPDAYYYDGSEYSNVDKYLLMCHSKRIPEISELRKIVNDIREGGTDDIRTN